MRYAKNINITIQLQEGGNGKILPPYITVEYGELKNTDYDSGEADVSVLYAVLLLFCCHGFRFRNVNPDLTIAINSLSFDSLLW